MNKKIYKKPTITKIKNTVVGKAGIAATKQKIRTHIDDIAITDLVKEHGSPLFVLSEKTIIDTYNKAYEAFSSRYPNIQFSWSYKTNYLRSVCSIFHKLGSIAEVVSEFEYEKARNLGIEGKNIIFNGPYKPLDSLLIAAEEGAKIHIDNFDEINDLEKVSEKTGKIIPVAIRLNMDTGIYPQWSRFGFNIDNGQAIDAVRRIEAGGKLKLIGLHSHIGTFMLSADPYRIQTTKMINLMKIIESTTSFKIEYLDIGGGFASKNRLKGVYQPPEITIPSIDDYAEAITTALYENLQPGKYPKLYLETGRHLIDEAGYLITSIVATKLMPDSRRSYIVDAGVNNLYTSTWYKFNIESVQNRDGIREPAMINGPLCMNIDVIDESIMLPRLKRNDQIIISPVGAYNITQWMQFIRYRPKVILIGKNNEVDVIRRAEKLSDIETPELLPERLNNVIN